MEKNDFIVTLETLRKRNYAYAGIVINGKTHYICLDDIKYLDKSSLEPVSFYQADKNILRINHYGYGHIDTFQEYFLKFKENYKKYHEETIKRGYEPLTEKEILAKIILDNSKTQKGEFYKTIKKTNITLNGNLAIIDKTYKGLAAFTNKEYQGKECFYADYVFNVSKIDMIVPFKEEREITSKECLEVIEEIESSGKVIGSK